MAENRSERQGSYTVVPMDISICILTRNQPELLPRCVASCIAEVQRAGVKAEVIVVDNASADGNPQKVALLSPLVRVVRNEEDLGFAAGNNKAIRMSQGRYVLILNDDAWLEEGSLRLLLQELDSNPRAGAVGPRLLNPDGSLPKNFTNRRLPRVRAVACEFLGLEAVMERSAFTRDLFTHNRGADVSGEAEHIAGACLLARREALEGIGLFDEGFRYWFEDCDLCYRLRKAGWDLIYLREAQVVHYSSASLGKLTRLERDTMCFTSMMYYFRKHSGPAKYLAIRMMLALVVLVRGPLAALHRVWRGGWTRQEWFDAIGRSLRAVRLLLLKSLSSGRG